MGNSGTSGGFKFFVRGEIDIIKAARLITDREKEECKKTKIKYLELLVAHENGVESRSLWLYVNKASLKKPAVVAFLKMCLSDLGQEIARRFQLPLTEEELRQSREALLAALKDQPGAS